MMKTLAILLSSAAALVVACGSDSPKMIDAKVFMDAPGSGSSVKHLTVKNAPTATPWCSITVNGGTASTAAMQTVDITTDGMITLTAAPESASFELSANMWHHTTGDTGTGEAGTVAGSTSTAMVAVTTTADKCVWVCCPFSPGGNGCPTTDQCP
jgi:hypothetical protein